jgi:hypothetical protein
LVTETFARPRGHDNERVMACQYILNNSFLRASELTEAKYFL